MAIAFDAASKGNAGGASTCTFAHTTTGSDRLLLVGFMTVDTNSRTVSSVTYAGSAMTLAKNYTGPSARQMWVYYIYAPSTGANNVVITMNAAVSHNIVASSMSYTGVNQTVALQSGNVGSNGTASGNTVTTSVTTTVDPSWLTGFSFVNDNVTISGGTATTKRTASTYGNGFLEGFDSNGDKTPTGSYSLITNTSGNTVISSVVIPITEPVGAVTRRVFSIT